MSGLVNITAGAGSAQAKNGQSIGTFMASLGSGAVVFGVQLTAFYLLKNNFTRIYRPKTYLVPEKDRTKPPPTGLFRWLVPVFNTTNKELISKCGLDAYFFLRYLRMLLKIFVPAAFLILLILLPLNSRAIDNGVSGLDKFGWTNYDRAHTNRFWAHLLLAIGFIFWIFHVIDSELRGYIRVRQAYLTSPQHRLRASATTVLIRSIPRKWLTYEALDGLFDVYPGGIRNIWINRDYDELNDKVKLRDKLASKLESAETALIRKAKKQQLKKAKQQRPQSDTLALTGEGISVGQPVVRAETTDQALHGNIGTEPSTLQKVASLVKGPHKRPEADRTGVRADYAEAFDMQYTDDQGMDQDPVWRQYLEPKDRSSMRLPILSFMPFLPSWTFLGTKVDTIYYCRKEVARLNVEIETDQLEPEKFPLMNSAFIQFENQVAAHMACQSLAHDNPNMMAPRLVEIAPSDVLWDNMSIGYKQRLARRFVVLALIAGMVVLWAVPVSITSAFNNLQTIQETWPAFAWIGKLPSWLINALQGILPALLLGILLAVLPLILRFLSGFQGVPTGMHRELDVQGFYFAFLFVQVFLIVTISSSIFNVFKEISEQPQQIAYILATNIPRAANYFFSYLILQALSVSSGALAQVSQLAVWFLWRPIVDKTARQKFNRHLNLQSVEWGTFFPIYTNLACIGIIYSIISPLVMVFNIITFGLFWVTYRYQTLYVNKYTFDTGGLLFPKAINQLFTGLYIMELALVGLFLLVENSQGQKGKPCLPQAIVMIVMLVVTVVYHVLMNLNFRPLFKYMPITLEDDAVKADEDFRRMQEQRWKLDNGEESENTNVLETNRESEDIEDQLEHQEQRERQEEDGLESIELQKIQQLRSGNGMSNAQAVSRGGTRFGVPSTIGRWADKSKTRRVSHAEYVKPNPEAAAEIEARRKQHLEKVRATTAAFISNVVNADDPIAGHADLPFPATTDTKKRVNHTEAVGDALFGAFNDEIEDLTAEERETLIQRAFQHSAIRARRPVIWLPRDDLGISDDEVMRMQAFGRGNIWASNEGTGLDGKARVLFRRPPPDFSEVDLIEL